MKLVEILVALLLLVPGTAAATARALRAEGAEDAVVTILPVSNLPGGSSELCTSDDTLITRGSYSYSPPVGSISGIN